MAHYEIRREYVDGREHIIATYNGKRVTSCGNSFASFVTVINDVKRYVEPGDTVEVFGASELIS